MSNEPRAPLTDTPLYRLTYRLARWVVVSVLWLVCSLPLVTLGAATVGAMGAFSGNGEESGITGGFFRYFRKGFFRATALWLLTAALAGVLVLDVLFYRQLTARGGGVLIALMLVLGDLLLNGFRFTCYRLAAGEDGSFRAVLKQGALTMVLCLPVLAIMTAMDLVVFTTVARVPYLMVVFVILPGLYADVHSGLIRSFLCRSTKAQ